MYTKIPYKNKQPLTTKVQAIRYLKTTGLRYKVNDPKIIKWAMKDYKREAIRPYKLGIYLPLYPEGELINISNSIDVPLSPYTEYNSGNSYGVCDNVQNFLDVFDEELKTSIDKVFVTLTPIHKHEQYECDGWRWRKWGHYIGNQIPTTEYLYDEPLIDTIYLYHIYKLDQGR